MEKKDIIQRIRKLLLEITNSVLFVIILPFFPILFFFDLCLVIGYPLFLRYVLKRKWFECCKNKILQMKYILLPILFLEALTLLTVIISYPNEILQAS